MQRQWCFGTNHPRRKDGVSIVFGLRRCLDCHAIKQCAALYGGTDWKSACFQLTSFMPSGADTEHFRETTIDGPRTKRWVLERGDCGEFNAHRIARLGIEEAVAPYRRVRMQ